jgi:hypothetical protein
MMISGPLRGVALTVAALLGATTLGCPTAPTPLFSGEDLSSDSPLGPSYVLMPLPNEDDAILGRILGELPEPGRSLEEVAKPNPCKEHLEPPRDTPLASSFEDAVELSTSAGAHAMLGGFGFAGDVQHATHFVYKLTTTRRLAQVDTTAYTECCKDNECGYGFVGALIYGEGEYATGEETAASVKADFAFGGASGGLRLQALHRRKVKGWIAAVVRVRDRDKASQLTPFGLTTEQIGISEEGLSDIVRPIYERGKVTVETTDGDDWQFQDGTGEAISENEFARRYRKTVSDKELEDIEQRRNTTSVVLLGSSFLVGAGMMTVAIYGSVSDFEEGPILAAGIPGAALFLGGGIGTGITMFAQGPYDGSAEDHVLTEADARLLAARYNRSLLRKSLRKATKAVSRRPALFELRPYFGGTGAGVFGSF